MPGGQEQVALWLEGMQVAWGLQGELNRHGLTQALFSQDFDGGHSKSDEQPTSTGKTRDIEKIISLPKR